MSADEDEALLCTAPEHANEPPHVCFKDVMLSLDAFKKLIAGSSEQKKLPRVFRAFEPLVTPRINENKNTFMGRCMENAAVQSEFGKGTKQAVGVCLTQWGRGRASAQEAAAPCCDACATGSGECSSGEAISVYRSAASTVKVEEQMINGERVLTFPIVMMLEGVRQAANSPAPELLMKDAFVKAIADLGKSTTKGRLPLVFTHPKRGKAFVSVHNKHDTGTGLPLGYLDQLRFVGGKMVGQAHMYYSLAEKAGKGALTQYANIKARRMVEVSVGHAARILQVAGRYRGQSFYGVHANPILDHLAIMEPNKEGACSVADGCGTNRANASNSAKTLYASRPLLNVDAFSAWATKQGLVLQEDPHVTIVYSTTPIEWPETDPAPITVVGGARGIKQLGDEGAVALTFDSSRLRQRWEALLRAGAVSDYDTFCAHVTITCDPVPDIAAIEPYEGPLEFGPEEFAEIDVKAHVRGYILESTKFRGVFAIVDNGRTISMGSSDPIGLQHHDESSFAVVFENKQTGKSVMLGQRFRRLSEAKFAAKERLARMKNADLIAIVARRLGSAEIHGHGRRPIYRDVAGLTYREVGKAQSAS